MTATVTAEDHLATGDSINEQLNAGISLAAAAARLGITPKWATKLAWLSRTFTAAAREEIGTENLARLRITHLEAIAGQQEHLRVPLLIAAAEERLSVRNLRQRAAGLRSSCQLADQATDTVERSGGPDAMRSTERALTRYARMPKDQLLRIYTGKSGPYIVGVIRAAHQLEARITQEGGESLSVPPNGGNLI
ncbi:hypothetical protein [Streptomyces xanthochromogenes]|uniref:Uncharacterized protein n=1 Tax=Streptomyces xanthochromogenes TaxID=67384 RepID=A0ABQ2ZPK5_9ACTN|nr:hypothetical protein [Streptomyces xanthochromogenes]GGY21053.1 hypothetical protein GCM10010326_12250 [Streptomyces xanthochromogenes]